MTKLKFQTGDRVRVIYDRDGLLGKTGTIVVDYDGLFHTGLGYYYGVEFDKPMGGHGCCGYAKDGYGWNLRESDLESLSTFVECDPTSLL